MVDSGRGSTVFWILDLFRVSQLSRLATAVRLSAQLPFHVRSSAFCAALTSLVQSLDPMVRDIRRATLVGMGEKGAE